MWALTKIKLRPGSWDALKATPCLTDVRDCRVAPGTTTHRSSVGEEGEQGDPWPGIDQVVEQFAAATSQLIADDPELLAMFQGQLSPTEHNRLLAEHLRAVLAGASDPARSREVGHAHVRAGLRPSTYLLAYNQVFACIHAVPAQELPPLPALRSRWLDDACATLDAYHEALLRAWAREREALNSDVVRLGQEATTDDLTGVLNRRGFIRTVQSSRRAGCLLLLDLDGFKSYNDRAGHPAGDAVLRTVGHALTAMSRPGDAAGRLGGDEFAVWLEGGTPTAAHSVLERVRSALPAGVGVSGGTAACASGPHDFTRLHTLADAALYEQKRARPDADRSESLPD